MFTHSIKDFSIIGASNRCLILDIRGRKVFCSTRNYYKLLTDPTAKWDIVERREHVGCVAGKEVMFPAQLWIVTYKQVFL